MASPADWYPEDLQSRLTMESRRERIIHPRLGEMDLVYCVSCHKPRGAVLPQCESVIILCDDCGARYGGLPARRLTQQEMDQIGVLNVTVKEI